MKEIIHSLDEIHSTAEMLISTYPNERFFAFYGSMGVGKTTLIKEICAVLGVEQNVCSPTFAVINEYCSADNEPIYHFDFYRIKTAAEVYDLGYEEYFYSGYYCFTEWTEKIEDFLPEHYVKVSIEELDGMRSVVTEVIDQ